MTQQPSRPRNGRLSPIPLQRQNSGSSLQSTTTYHSFAAPMPSPVLARSSLYIETRATARPTSKVPSRKTPSPAAERMLRTESPKPYNYGYRRNTPSPGAEKMMRIDSGYADGNGLPLRTSSPVMRTNSPVPRTTSPLSYTTKERQSRIPSPVQTQSTFSSRQKKRPLPIRTSISESQSSSRNSSQPRRHHKQSSTVDYQPSTPTSPSSPTFSEESRDSSVATSTNPSSKPSRPRPSRQNKSATTPSGNRRVSRPSSARRYNSTPVISPSREVPFQFFQFPPLNDEGAENYPSPPGSSSGNALGISGAIGNAQVGRPVPSTVQYWTSPETRRKEYEAIDAASRGVRGFCLKILPDCLVPKEYKVQGFAQKEEGEEMAERGRKASESTNGGSLRKRPGKRGKGDGGSVRRYRIEIEETEVDEVLEREHERARREQGGKRKWFSWARG